MQVEVAAGAAVVVVVGAGVLVPTTSHCGGWLVSEVREATSLSPSSPPQATLLCPAVKRKGGGCVGVSSSFHEGRGRKSPPNSYNNTPWSSSALPFPSFVHRQQQGLPLTAGAAIIISLPLPPPLTFYGFVCKMGTGFDKLSSRKDMSLCSML